MGKVVLVRHGESQWNEKGLWTGFVDIDLDEEGIIQAQSAGEALKGIHFTLAYCSVLRRAIHTLEVIFQTLGYSVPVFYSDALNERNYGVYTGKNKWDIEKEFGEEKFEEIRRGWATVIPEGENLSQVYDRVSEYYRDIILPKVKEGNTVLISLHGNSMRALIKHIENLSVGQVEHLEVATGEVYVYDINSQGVIVEKSILNTAKKS